MPFLSQRISKGVGTDLIVAVNVWLPFSLFSVLSIEIQGRPCNEYVIIYITPLLFCTGGHCNNFKIISICTFNIGYVKKVIQTCVFNSSAWLFLNPKKRYKSVKFRHFSPVRDSKSGLYIRKFL